MSARILCTDRDWMTLRLARARLTEFDRVNALAMMGRGVIIGSLLCRMWRKVAHA